MTQADRAARAEAERVRLAWLRERHEARHADSGGYRSGERQRFEKERGRFLASELLECARVEEQKRISRELHDRVYHSMGVVHQGLQLYEALKERDPEEARAKLELAKRMTMEAMEQTRDLSSALREAEGGFEPSLSELLREAVSPDIGTELKVEGNETNLGPRVRDRLCLILREAIRNAATHSGADKIRVHLNIGREEAHGVVEDDGLGPDISTARRKNTGGLTFMEERAQLLEGSCRISSGSSEGARVEVRIPLS